MFLSLDGTAWIQLINFGIFYLILNVVFLKPVGEALRKRREYIDGVKNDYDRFARQVAELRAEADAKRAAARLEAQELVVSARGQSEKEAAEAVAGYAEKAAGKMDEARATVDKERAAARTREPELAAGLAESLLARAIGAPAK